MSTNPQNTIAFMGVEGANADLACRQREPYMDTLGVASFEDVFEAVENDAARLGMIPIENSQAGRVAEIHNILPKSGLHIVGEHIQRIEHSLVAIKGAKREGITDVYSHPQALMQCREHLKAMGVNTHSYSNTATAARDIAEWNDPTKAAISSDLASELYNLDVLERNIEDADDNVTVFIVISKEPVSPEPSEGKSLTSVLFELRNIPAALYKVLGGFATNGVNMIKLESYIRGGGSRQAQFFMTFEGNPEEDHVKRAIEELGFFSKKTKVLGVYLADKTRY